MRHALQIDGSNTGVSADRDQAEILKPIKPATISKNGIVRVCSFRLHKIGKIISCRDLSPIALRLEQHLTYFPYGTLPAAVNGYVINLFFH